MFLIQVIDMKHNIFSQSVQVHFFIFKYGGIMSLPQVPDEKEEERKKIILSLEPVFKIFQYRDVRLYQRVVKVPLEEVYDLMHK